MWIGLGSKIFIIKNFGLVMCPALEKPELTREPIRTVEPKRRTNYHNRTITYSLDIWAMLFFELLERILIYNAICNLFSYFLFMYLGVILYILGGLNIVSLSFFEVCLLIHVSI